MTVIRKILFTTSLFVAIAVSQQSVAQRKNDVDPDKDLRMSVLPYYNFGKGLGLTAPDSIFQLNIRFRMQNRATYQFMDGDQEDKINAEVRRLRLRFDGYVANPKFKYAIQLSFSPGDTGGAIDEGQNLQVIRDAVIFYQPSDSWTFSFGQTKLPGNRQRLNSSGALQLTDRSINNAKFTLDRDFGLQAHSTNEFKNKFSYNFKAAISTGEGRNDTENSDTGLAYTGKVELYPFGAFSNNGSLFEGDMAREQKPKLLLSGAYSHNDRASRSQGQLGEQLFEKRNLKSLFLDAMFKYDGWAMQAAFMNRNTSNPITRNPNDLNQISYVFVGHGLDYQLSYLFENNYELVGRYSTQKVKEEIHPYTPNQNQYSLALTKYIWEHAFKLQAEVSRDELTYFSGVTRNNWYVRFQIEIGI